MDSAKRRTLLKSRGLCQDCGKRSLSPQSVYQCETCFQKKRLRQLERRFSRKAIGRCVTCSRNLAFNGATRCPRCLDLAKIYTYRYEHNGNNPPADIGAAKSGFTITEYARRFNINYNSSRYELRKLICAGKVKMIGRRRDEKVFEACQ